MPRDSSKRERLIDWRQQALMTAPVGARGVITLRQDGKVWRTDKQE